MKGYLWEDVIWDLEIGKTEGREGWSKTFCFTSITYVGRAGRVVCFSASVAWHDSRATKSNFVGHFTAQSTMKRLKLAIDDSNKGFVCSSSNSSTIADPEIWQLNESVYELHKPEGEPTMQVVFFHGFQYRNSDDVHLSTWESRDRSHYWPQTWLVEAFHGAHVFCVSYDARVEKGEGNFDLYSITENLTWDLVKANIGQVGGCPVILVGHCFGGLVIKKLCLHAHEAVGSKGDSSGTGLKFRMFLQNVKGIFYYATPHHGISRDIAPWFGDQGPLLPFVKKFSEYSARLNSEFEDLRHGHYTNAWQVAGVGETLRTNWGLFKEVLVVPEESARHGSIKFNLVEKTDHFSISKPESNISRNFSALTDLIDSVLNLKVNDPVHECQGLPYYPVDLERQAQDIREKLKVEQVLGIVGMGGIGKTTLAKQLFNNMSREFEYTCFVDNAKEIKVHKLEDRLLGKFHRKGVDQPKIEWKHLKGTKTLIVIDDVNSEDQLKFLPKLHHFGSDSRVIITSRNRSVLNTFEAYVVHDVQFLKEADARALFCKHAFKQGEIPSSLTGREQLVKDVKAVVRKCDGLPLTLEVIGSRLRGHESDANLWKDTIVRLGTAEPIGGDREDRVWAKLQVSYDALRREEQEMFISAATFFFDSPLERALAAWSTTCRTPVTGWRNLVEKSLVKEVCSTTYSRYGFRAKIASKAIWVHEHLRDLGKILAPGNTMSASNKEDLQNLSGLSNAHPVDAKTEFLELLNPRQLMEVSKESKEMTFEFQFKSLRNMKQLKYVELKGVGLIGNSHQRFPCCVVDCGRGSRKKFPTKISLLCWDRGYPQHSGCYPKKYEHFPISCIEEMENLAILELRHWQTSQAFPEALGKLTNLRILELCSIRALYHLPEDFGCQLSNLKHLKLEGLSLSKLPESFGKLSSLEYIHFKELALTELPKSFGNLSSLVTAEFLYCKNLVTLPANFGLLPALETLVLGDSRSFGLLPALETLVLGDSRSYRGGDASMMLECLPDSFGQLKALRWLFMNVKKMQSLPSNFCSLSSLEELIIFAEQLETLPDSLEQPDSLRGLEICCPKIKYVPDSWWTPSSLRELTITGCEELVSLPEGGHPPSLQELSISGSEKLKTLPHSLGRPSSLRDLTISECGDIEFLPEGLGDLPCLETLKIQYCKKLKSLPDSLGRSSSLIYLNIIGCEELVSLPEGGHPSLQTLWIWVSEKLKTLPHSLGRSSSLRDLIISECGDIEFLPEGLGDLPCLETLKISHCKKLKSLPDSLGRSSSLRLLSISGCGDIEFLPEGLGDLPCLETLWIEDCKKLKTLPDSLGRSSSLRKLDVEAQEWEFLPEWLGDLPSLQSLYIRCCEKLKSLPDGLRRSSSLRDLIISWCGDIEFLPEGLGDLPCLETLEINGCEKLKTLPDNLGRSSSLRRLDIEGQEWEFPPEWLGDLPSLQSLHIEFCEKLKSLPDGLRRSSSLRELVIWIEDWEFLPAWLGDLSSLQRLEIRYCPKLKSLPDNLGISPSRHETTDGQKYTSSSNGLKLVVYECPLLDESMLNTVGWVRTDDHNHHKTYVRGSKYERKSRCK